MSSVFAHQAITDAGLALASSATSSNPIVWTMGISSTTVPSDPEDKTQYTGLEATIDAASATQNVARIVVGFSNDTNETVAVKAVALLGKLANQSASQAVIAAYVYDENSSIELSPSEMQRTRFAFNLVFNGVSTVSVFQTGDLTVADAERFVSCHAAGNPTLGESQTVYGDKEWDGEQIFDNLSTFMDTVITRTVYPATTNRYNLGTANNRWDTLFANAGNFAGSIATQNIYCRGKVGGKLFEIEERGTIGNSEIAGIYDDESDTYSLNIGGGDASGSRGMLTIKPCIVTTDASTGEKTETMVPVYLGTRTYRFQKVYTLALDAQRIISPLVSTEEFNLVSSADPSVYATAVLTNNAISVSKDIAPASNSGTIQNCGRLDYPWNKIYAKNEIVLTAGNTATRVFTITEDNGRVVFDNYLPGGDTGTFLFATNGGNTRAKVLAREYEGFNSTISSLAPRASNSYRLDVGALVLAVASSFWIDKKRGQRFFPGDVLDLTDRSYPWYVGQQTVNTSTGNVTWDGYLERVDETLPAGKYKLLNVLRVYDAGGDHTMTASVLLQRVE
jgi:hypothetical protein